MLGLAAFAVGASLGLAPADPVDDRVEWDAPACAQRSAFDAALETRLDQPPRLDVEMRFEIRESSGAYALVSRVVVAGNTELRQIDSDSCAKLVDAAAMLAAMAFDPTPKGSAASSSVGAGEPIPAAKPQPAGPELESWQSAVRDGAQGDPAQLERRARAEIAGGGALIGGGIAAGAAVGYGVYRASLTGLGPAGPRDRLTTIAITTGVLSGVVIAAATTAGGATLVRRGRKRKAELVGAGVTPTASGARASVTIRF